MKHSKLFLLLMALVLSGCSLSGEPSNNDGNKNTDDTNENGNNNNNDGQGGGSTTPDDGGNTNPDDGGNTNPDDGGGSTPIDELPAERRMQDTPILHCWNWSMNNIANNLQNIKSAGFKAIQISPMQNQKDYYGANGGDDIQNGWWKLYQPVSFVVATKDHSIGVKSELTTMCAKAEQLGIDVIVDVVFNHMANNNENDLESDGTPKVNSQVNNYESYIYEHRNDSTNPTFHHNKNATGSGAETQYYPYGGLPDLNTSNAKVQERALSYLKECIDCGVDGFRFDAAKHIETPDDPQYPSNFWTETLGKAETYYKTKTGKDLFAYGEILGNPSGRSNTVYTKMMSITDSSQSSNAFKAVQKKDTALIKQTYDSKVSPSKLVIWGESHDTFANNDGETKGTSQEDIDKVYAMQVSRKDAACLYLARPNSMSQKMGAVGSTAYQGNVIKAVNNFHNDFVGKSENIFVDNKCFVNVRGGQGAVIVNINNSSTSNVKIAVSGLANGTYTEMITNKKVTVSNSEVTVSFTNGVCVLVNDNKTSEVPPTLSLSVPNEIYTGSTSVTVSATNATSMKYSINNGTETALSGNSIALDSSLANGPVDVKVIASNQYGSTTKTIKLFKLATSALINKSLIIYNIDSNYTYYVWAWSNDSDGAWRSPTVENNVVGFDTGNATQFVLVKFNKSVTSPNWDNKLQQTEDISLDGKVYNYQDLPIKAQ